MTEKMESGILGFAVGDALGVPVEFLTSLVVATMDSIIENRAINFEDIMYKFSEWLDYAKYTATDKLFDVGISTSESILNFKRGKIAINCGGKGIYENGNGSLMRMLPVVYYLKCGNFSEEERINLIHLASSLTHAHEISLLGCKIYADYISFLLDGIDRFNALYLLKQIDYSKYYSKESLQQYERILKGDLESLHIDDIKSSGYVVDTLEASIWCTLKSNTYEEAVITAVNLGEDTDTVGAIVGSINGIIYGKNSIPERWLEKLKKREYLEQLSNQFVVTINIQKSRKI